MTRGTNRASFSFSPPIIHALTLYLFHTASFISPSSALTFALPLLLSLLRRGSDQVTPPVLSVEHPTTLHQRSSEERTTVSTGVNNLIFG